MMTAKIQDWPLDKFIEYELNPRVHTPEMIATAARAISTFGFRVPMLARTSGEIIDGHLRLKAARALGLDSVPVILADDMSPEMVKAFRLSVNRIADLADWNEELLAHELDQLRDMDFDMDAMGFSRQELNDLIGTPNTGVDPDAVPPVPAVPVSRAGDLWLLGTHRLLCGDSSKDAAAFLSGITPDLLFFDPPYEVAEAWALTVPTEKALVFTDHKHIREAMGVVLAYPVQYHFVWDTVISWYTQNRPLCRHRSAFYCAQVDGWDADAATCVDGKQRDEHTVVGGQAFAGDYHYKPLSGGRVRVTTLYQQVKTLDEAGNGKPVAWVRALLAGAQAREVYEPFAGTGATIMAAPGNCRVHAIEIDPLKCDVMVARWETATGGTATRA